MKRVIFSIIGLMTIQNAVAQQSFVGLRSAGHSGVHSLMNNPASIAGHQRKWDVNLLSIDANIANDAVGLTMDKAEMTKRLEALLDKKDSPISGGMNIDVLGPSFFFKLNDKHSLGLSSRMRAMIDLKKFNPGLLMSFIGKTNELDFASKEINIHSQSLTANVFRDFGVSYAGVFFQTERHTLKAGATLKLVQGTTSTTFGIENLQGRLELANVSQNDAEIVFTGQGSAELAMGGVDFSTAPKKVDTYLSAQTSSVAFDLGVEYELKRNPEDTNYWIKVGAAITDMGSLKYTVKGEDFSRRWSLPSNFSATLSNMDKLKTELEKIQEGEKLANTEVNASLPAALRLQADVRVFKNIYVDINTQFGLTENEKKSHDAFYRNVVSVTPRIENRYFGFYLPVSSDYSGTSFGAALRLGPLFVGSSNVINQLASKEAKSFNAFLGLRFGL